MHMSRFEFVRSVAVGTGAVVCGLGWPATNAYAQTKKKKDRGPRLELEVVGEFVRVAHFNLDRVKALLAKEPALINAAWDWGGGDWETALGAAGHMGLRDTALYLLDHGARLDVFAAAMLGKLDFVKAALEAFPGALDTPGPHGIPLIAHAKKGGEAAADVVTYLESLL